jgi:phosphoribosyl-ATP pyrophosphohydrolase
MTDKLAQQLQALAATIASRRGADPDQSYTARLLARGPAEAAKKFGEEAVELVIAAAQGYADGIAAESADVLYHWLVLLEACGVSPDAVADALAAREGQSGIDEKASRTPSPPSSSGGA